MNGLNDGLSGERQGARTEKHRMGFAFHCADNWVSLAAAQDDRTRVSALNHIF
jgi:hypothetical protein